MTTEASAHAGTGTPVGNGTVNGNVTGHGTGSGTGAGHGKKPERSAVIEVLQDAVARGLLTHDEGGERMAAALAAKFRDELPAMTADLPPAPPSTPKPVLPLGWRGLGSAFNAQVRSDVRAAREAGPRSRRFVTTALIGFLVIAFLLTLFGLALAGLFDGGGYGHGWEHHHDWD